MTIRKPRTKLEAEYTYTNKFSGRQIQFTPKPDEIVASFQLQPDAKIANEVMKAVLLSPSKTMSAERGVAVFRVPVGQNLQTTRQVLEATPHVANTMPVLIDDEGFTRYFVPDELTVQFRQGVSKEEAERIISQKHCQIVIRQRTPGYYTLAVDEGKGVFEMLREFSGLEQVDFAEPSEFAYDIFNYSPDEPQFFEQYGLFRISAPAAWDITQGASNVIIAVIDTGADLDHPDLAANILPRGQEDWNFAFQGKIPEDSFGHGTHVAGIAAAVDNAIGIIGVAPRCRIMPLKIGAGLNVHLPAAVDAINYVGNQLAVNPNLRYVINLSWGDIGNSAGVHRAIKNVVDRNALIVATTGNNNKDTDEQPFYPGVYPEVIAVAATDLQDVKASFSNFGTKTDVSAPGDGIFSTFLNGTHDFLSGTSMAAPHVAGLAALIWSLDPTINNNRVRQIIENTCDNIDAQNPDFKNKLGKGRINAHKALVTVAFSLLLPNKLNIVRSTSKTVDVAIKRGVGFNADVTLSIATPPIGITASFSPTSTSGNTSKMTVNVDTVPFRSYNLMVQAITGNITKFASLQLIVKPFTLELSESSVTFQAGNRALIEVTIERSPGFNDSVHLSYEGFPDMSSAPQGGRIRVSFNPNSTDGNTSSLTITAGRFVPETSFVLTIRGASGTLNDTVQLGVEVLPSNVAPPPRPIEP